MTTIERMRTLNYINNVDLGYDLGLYDWMEQFTKGLGKECAKELLQDYYDYHSNERGYICAGYCYNFYTKEVWDYLADDLTR